MSAGGQVLTRLGLVEAVADRVARHGQAIGILKIGAHCSPSIAVTLNENLDYFGQTANVAARVQFLADAGEICISLYTAPGVSALRTGYKIVEFDAPPKMHQRAGEKM